MFKCTYLRPEYHLFYCTRCLTMWKVVKRIFWTRASGKVLLSILSRSRPSPPFSSAAWRYSFRSWTRWRSIFRNLFFSGKPNDVIVGGERHRRGNWESKLPRQADDRWNLRGGFYFSTKLELERWNAYCIVFDTRKSSLIPWHGLFYSNKKEQKSRSDGILIGRISSNWCSCCSTTFLEWKIVSWTFFLIEWN